MGQSEGSVACVAPLLLVLAVAVGTMACPYPCTCTQFKVDCYGKGLTEIPDTFPPGITSIDLQYNNIHTIGDQFHNLTSLTEVMLRFNRITHLANDTFAHLPALQHINLGSNLISNISAWAFHNVSKLNILDLTENQLSNMADWLEGLSSVTKLVLTRNTLEELKEDSLLPLTELVYFMADENRITTIHPAAFRHLTKLSFVSLINNPLQSMDDVLTHNAMLSYLNLDQCRLTNIPTGLPWATRNLQLRANNISALYKNTFLPTRYLGVVILDNNIITHVDPGTFAPIAHLQELWLSDNKLTAIPAPIPTTVHTLYLENNAITSVTSADFPSDCQLMTLSLKGNQISRIDPFTFSKLASLQKMYVSHNNIAQLQEKSFFGMRNLTLLDVSHNPIMHIEVRFAAGLHKLDTLDMSYIDDSEPFVQGDFFRDVPYLKTLVLRYSPSLALNILTSNETLQSFYHLQELDARNNNLLSLDTDLPRFFPSLQRVKLAGNAWVCDPRLLWLHDWMQSNRDVFVDIDSIVCAAPFHLAGSIIADLPYHAFFYTTTLLTTIAESEEDNIGSGVENCTTGPAPLSEATPGAGDSFTRGYTDQDLVSAELDTLANHSDHTHAKETDTMPTSTSAPDNINNTADKSTHDSHTTVTKLTTSAMSSPEETTTTKPKVTTPTEPHQTSRIQTTTTTTPKPTDLPRYDGSKINTDAHSSSITRNIIIATCAAGAVLIITVIALVLILRHKHKIYWVLNRAKSSRRGDTELVLADQDDPDSRCDCNAMKAMEKSEQGSTPSVESASDDGLCTRLV